MKLKFLITLFISLNCFSLSHAQETALKNIYAHQGVRCGTNLASKTYAYQDKEKRWVGIDADLCRAFALAILGNSDAIEMIHVDVDKIAKALNSGQIDVMLGNNAPSANYEISNNIETVTPIYFDKQVFAAHAIEGATSMEDYKGATVCVLKDSLDAYNVKEYSRKYGLHLKSIPFRNMQDARAAFFTNRCQLFSSSEFYLTGITKAVVSSSQDIRILPETIAYQPVYAFVSKNNPQWRVTVKWILNALLLAESLDINSKNIDTVIGVENPSTKYLLGIDKKLWSKFNLSPEWVKQALKEMGNYGEIYERNVGKDSIIGIARDKNNLIENGGYLTCQPFL